MLAKLLAARPADERALLAAAIARRTFASPSGPGEAIMLVLTGRLVVRADLAGKGQSIL